MFNITNYQGTVNQSYNDITSDLSEWLSSKSQQILRVGEDVEKREALGGNVNWCCYYGKHEGFPPN